MQLSDETCREYILRPEKFSNFSLLLSSRRNCFLEEIVPQNSRTTNTLERLVRERKSMNVSELMFLKAFSLTLAAILRLRLILSPPFAVYLRPEFFR